jgi:hypothetical protein
MTKKITSDFLIKTGFEIDRIWSDHAKQFRITFKIEGYDCDILISPVPQAIPEPIQRQVDDFSDINFLKHYHINDWGIFVNSMDNHLTTFRYEKELINLMKICKTPLHKMI